MPDRTALRLVGALAALAVLMSVPSLPSHDAVVTGPSTVDLARYQHLAATRVVLTGSTPAKVAVGRKVRLRARVLPGTVGRTVQLQRRTGRGWTVLTRLRTRAGGAVSVVVSSPAPATLSLRLRAPATRGRRAAVSRPVRLVVAAARVAAPVPPPPVPTTAVPATAGEYTFSTVDDQGRPARWNPCKPITWRYNPARQREASDLLDVQAGIGRLAAATGLRYVYAGTTTDSPYRPDLGNTTAEDLLVGWGDQNTHAALAGSVAGYAGTSTRYRVSASGVRGPQEIVSAQMVLDHDGTALAPGLAPGLTLGALVLHELGHTAGLGHSPGAAEVMYPTLSGAFTGDYNVGDLAGLRQLGASNGCFASPLR
jgi:Matrixin